MSPGGVWKHHPPRPPPPAFISERCCSRERLLFFGPSLPHRSKDLDKKKNQPGLACCYGATPHLHPPPSLPPPSPPLLLLLLLLFYNIRLLYCTSTAIPPLHLVSSPEPFGRCVAARHETERREADGREELQNKSSSVCTGDVTLRRQQRREVAVSLFTLPTLYPYLWCPC